MRSPEGPRGYRGPVRRVRIVISDGEWRIASQTRVDRMTIPTSDAPIDRFARGGSFVELTDADGEVIHWERIEDPTVRSVEVFEPGGRIHREVGDLDAAAESVVEIFVPDDRPLGALRLVANGREMRAAGRADPGGVPLDRPGPSTTGR